MWYIYILLCKDGSLYTGITKNIDQRFKDHTNSKGGAYTKSHHVVKIVYTESASNHSEALKRELQIKSWDRKKKIQMLKLLL